MYCPQCSQQQISDEMRFCSRCGFPLGTVKELIASGGVVSLENEPRTQALLRALRSVKKGAWILLATLLVALFVGLLTGIDGDFAVLFVVPFLSFVVAIVWILYATFVQARRATRQKKDVEQLGPMLAQHALPASPGTPVESFRASSKQTAEVAQPPSVTENTTRLLDNDA